MAWKLCLHPGFSSYLRTTGPASTDVAPTFYKPSYDGVSWYVLGKMIKFLRPTHRR